MDRTVIWLCLTWNGLAGAVILFALQQEIGAIRQKQGGANGLMWLAAMVFGALGALIAAALAWAIADGTQALQLLGWTAAALFALGLFSVKRINAEIRKALTRSRSPGP